MARYPWAWPRARGKCPRDSNPRAVAEALSIMNTQTSRTFESRPDRAKCRGGTCRHPQPLRQGSLTLSLGRGYAVGEGNSVCDGEWTMENNFDLQCFDRDGILVATRREVCILHAASYILDVSSYMLHVSSYMLHLASYILLLTTSYPCDDVSEVGRRGRLPRGPAGGLQRLAQRRLSGG